MSDSLVVASSDDDYRAFAALYVEYQRWLELRYAGVPGLIDTIVAEQRMPEELASLPEAYGPPNGKTVLAWHDGTATGCVSYRRLSDDVCEMKRLFVPERLQGRGTGRQLCERLMAEAQQDGFSVMVLDTGRLQDEATALYTSLGFEECGPYHQYPPEVMPHIRFMEATLTPPSSAS